MTRAPHHFTIEVIAGDDRVIGYRCADAGCRKVESVLERCERIEAERARDEHRERQRELVAWKCNGGYDFNGVVWGCGVELRLTREDAERQSYCCVACRRRCQRARRSAQALPPPCAKCGAGVDASQAKETGP